MAEGVFENYFLVRSFLYVPRGTINLTVFELEKIPKYSSLGSQARTFVEYLYYFLTFQI